jgi:hypothetical protein
LVGVVAVGAVLHRQPKVVAVELVAFYFLLLRLLQAQHTQLP